MLQSYLCQSHRILEALFEVSCSIEDVDIVGPEVELLVVEVIDHAARVAAANLESIKIYTESWLLGSVGDSKETDYINWMITIRTSFSIEWGQGWKKRLAKTDYIIQLITISVIPSSDAYCSFSFPPTWIILRLSVSWKLCRFNCKVIGS